MSRYVVVAIALAACTGDVDPQWQLAHDRVIAVRATPPGIGSGEVAQIDALLGFKDQPPAEGEPDMAVVVSPTSLQGALTQQSTGWTVTEPPDDQLAAARTELGLAADAPVPLQLQLTFAFDGLVALKGVMLGQHADNPVLDPITIDGMDAVTQTQLSVPAGVDVPLVVDFDDTYNINWLTSCGTMHDFDLASAYLVVGSTDPQSGTLAIVVRDDQGGVAWQVWPISAQ